MKKPKIILHAKLAWTWGRDGFVLHPDLFWYTLMGRNNKVFTVSETFTRKSDAIRSIKRLCETFGIVDFELSDKTGDK